MSVPDYKNTIRLPQTDFPMKGNLPQREPQILQRWADQKIYQKLIEKNKNKKKFTLPDGPPYANGSIHVGHALNKILKDILIKYKNMTGHCSPFIPGWDCHGLPIEHKVTKELKGAPKSDTEIRQLCRAEAQKWVDTQEKQFQRLGLLADWENKYLTMHASYEAEEVREFARAFKKGVIYQGTKPVYWNFSLRTALADAEVEYHNHKSPSIYVKFPITDAQTLSVLGNPKEKTYVVIWTTTPWTLPANLGVCFHPDFTYSVFTNGSENFLFAKDLKESVEKDTGLTFTETGKELKGADLENLKAHHPFMDRNSVFVLGTHVTLDAGTGCVHTAPGHGMEDYQVGLKYNMEILSPVDEGGLYTDEVPEYKGTHIFKANPLIVEKLKSLELLLSYKEFEHSYPHCWRSKTPLFFRATPQWFLGLDLEGSQIREKTLNAIKEIAFYPSWGVTRLTAMMEGRPDWCLSRQRMWGVPIPLLYCLATGLPLADYDVMMSIAHVIEHEGGIDAFWSKPVEYFTKNLDLKKYNTTGHPEYGTQGFRHGKDILDVWFDSGVCHAAVQKLRPHMNFPADIYLEGSDQHRGWFNTSLLSSIATNDQAPYKALVTHGFVNDSQGRKMSKSLGNVVDPQDTTQKSGAEILRLWTIYGDYGQDVNCGETELTRVTETYRRIRNTMKFLLGATHDFDPATESVPYEKLTDIDKWALHRLFELTEKVTQAYEGIEFYKVYHLINNFFTVDLSAIYLDVLKDRLYTWKEKGFERKGSQTVLYTITDYITRMMAPVLSFLAEEVYDYAKGTRAESVFLLDFPVAQKEWSRPELLAQFDHYLKVREDVAKVLENLRAQKVIGSSLEAHVTIKAEGELLAALKNFGGLKELLIVSSVQVAQGSYGIEASKAEGEKCVRCWHFSTDTGKNTQFPAVCPKCVEALS